MASKIIHHKSSEYKTQPWKNGQGVTTEIACHESPKEGLLWRISIADIKEDGDFSDFSGIDRTLMLLEGNGISLGFENRQTAVLENLYDHLSFDGSDKIYCKLLGGLTRDFNVMTAQKHMSHKFEVIKNSSSASLKKTKADILLVFCLSAIMKIEVSGQTYILKQYDMLEINKAQDEHININAQADLTYALTALSLLAGN